MQTLEQTLEELMNLENWEPAPIGWQPIDTAPNDGTSVLLSCTHGMYVASRDKEDGHDGYGNRTDWWTVDDNKHGPYPLRGASPTHWMHLPAPPTP